MEQGRRMPFGGAVAVEREALLNIIDQMRITIPQDLRRYKEFEAEKDRYIAEAQDEARLILEQAREDAARLLDEQSIRRQAETDARRILEQARREAEEVRAGADAYALASLHELDRQVERLARTIQNGLSELARSQQAKAQAAEEVETDEGVPVGATPAEAREPAAG